MLRVEYFLESSQPLGLEATLNRLCSGPLSNFLVQGLFGVQRTGSEDCVQLQSFKQPFTNSHTVFIGLNVTIDSDAHELCAKAVLNGVEKIVWDG